MGQHARPAAASEDRLSRVTAMLLDAIELLNQAIEVSKGETIGGHNDGDAARPPDAKPEQSR